MVFKPHCNLCHTDIVTNNAVFTSCGHFICQECFSTKMRHNSEICCYCNQSCSILYLDDTIPDEIRQFIDGNPVELLSQVLEICRFQDTHNQCYIEYLTNQMKEQQAKITSLEAEIQQLKSSTPIQQNPLPPIKRPDFMFRFKSSLSSSQVPSFTPSRTQEHSTHPGTPSFIEKKPVNPFTKGNESRDPVSTPSVGRRGLDVPGSITRHPQLLKTPSRNGNHVLPFKLLRPPQSAPVLRSNQS